MSDSSPPWPGPDEAQVIAEMIADHGSPHWEDCDALVARLVHKRASNLGEEACKDIRQRVMIVICVALPGFKGQSRLIYWIGFIITAQISNYLRDERRQSRGAASLDARDERGDGLYSEVAAPLDIERLVALSDLICRIIRAIETYVATSSRNPERDAEIIARWLDSVKRDAIAAELDLAPYIVSNVIYQLKRHLNSFGIEWKDGTGGSQ